VLDRNPDKSPRLDSSSGNAAVKRPRSPLYQILIGAPVGAVIGCAVSIVTVFVIANTVGHMDYELSGLFAVFFGTIGGAPAAMTGVVVGRAEGRDAKATRMLLSTAFGGLCAGAIYSFIVVPLATVPAVVVFWMGVVPFVSGLAAGAVGGQMGIGTRQTVLP
jgi:hypothetical protein